MLLIAPIIAVFYEFDCISKLQRVYLSILLVMISFAI